MRAAQTFAALAAELCRVAPPDSAAARAEVVALLHFGGGLSITSGLVRLESEPVAGGAAGRTSALIKWLYDIDAPVGVGVVGHARPVVRIPTEDTVPLAMDLGLLSRSGAPIVGLPPKIVAEGAGKPEVAAAVLRGAVLAAGRMHRTNRGVLSLLIQCPGLAAAVALRGMARHVGAASMLRDSDSGPFAGHRLVLRDRSGLGEALEAMGAVGFASEHIDPEAMRRREEQTVTLRNSNRDRTLRASAAAFEKVRGALELLGDDIPEHLAVVARARLAHPQASMSELGQHCGITKDAVAGRLRRLCFLADGRDRSMRLPA